MRPPRSTPRLPLPASRLPRPAPVGFTLSEVVVALLLLACGALATVAASAGAIRVVADAELHERSIIAARDRVERLAARGCSSNGDTASSDSLPAGVERWAVSQVRGGVRLVTDTVTPIGTRRSDRALVSSRLVLC